jgi:hypothetical protein
MLQTTPFTLLMRNNGALCLYLRPYIKNEPGRKANSFFFSPGATQPIVGVYFTALYRDLASSRTRLLDHTQGRATIGRTPMNE